MCHWLLYGCLFGSQIRDVDQPVDASSARRDVVGVIPDEAHDGHVDVDVADAGVAELVDVTVAVGAGGGALGGGGGADGAATCRAAQTLALYRALHAL